MRKILGAMIMGGAVLISTMGLAIPANAGGVGTDSERCDPYKSYSVTSRWADELVKTIPTVQLYNSGTTLATLTTTVTITGSVSVSVNSTSGVDLSIVVASVKTQLSITVTYTLSGSWATSASVQVNAGQTGYIHGGIFRVVTNGNWYSIDSYCRVTNKAVVAKTPYYFGYIAEGH